MSVNGGRGSPSWQEGRLSFESFRQCEDAKSIAASILQKALSAKPLADSERSSLLVDLVLRQIFRLVQQGHFQCAAPELFFEVGKFDSFNDGEALFIGQASFFRHQSMPSTSTDKLHDVKPDLQNACGFNIFGKNNYYAHTDEDLRKDPNYINSFARLNDFFESPRRHNVSPSFYFSKIRNLSPTSAASCPICETYEKYTNRFIQTYKDSFKGDIAVLSHNCGARVLNEGSAETYEVMDSYIALAAKPSIAEARTKQQREEWELETLECRNRMLSALARELLHQQYSTMEQLKRKNEMYEIVLRPIARLTETLQQAQSDAQELRAALYAPAKSIFAAAPLTWKYFEQNASMRVGDIFWKAAHEPTEYMIAWEKGDAQDPRAASATLAAVVCTIFGVNVDDIKSGVELAERFTSVLDSPAPQFRELRRLMRPLLFDGHCECGETGKPCYHALAPGRYYRYIGTVLRGHSLNSVRPGADGDGEEKLTRDLGLTQKQWQQWWSVQTQILTRLKRLLFDPFKESPRRIDPLPLAIAVLSETDKFVIIINKKKFDTWGKFLRFVDIRLVDEGGKIEVYDAMNPVASASFLLDFLSSALPSTVVREGLSINYETGSNPLRLREVEISHQWGPQIGDDGLKAALWTCFYDLAGGRSRGDDYESHRFTAGDISKPYRDLRMRKRETAVFCPPDVASDGDGVPVFYVDAVDREYNSQILTMKLSRNRLKFVWGRA